MPEIPQWLTRCLGHRIQVDTYDNTQLQVRRIGLPRGHTDADATRGEVVELSRKSLGRLAFRAKLASRQFKSLITLTYATAPTSGKTAKRHLRMMLQRLRRMSRDIRYLWFVEFQRRGAVHFHILTNIEVQAAATRSRWWRAWAAATTDNERDYENVLYVHDRRGHGWQNLRSPEAAARYVSKYALKKEQKLVPKGYGNCGRFWGNSRNLGIPEADMTLHVSHAELMHALAAIGHRVATWHIAPRSIYDVSTQLIAALVPYSRPPVPAPRGKVPPPQRINRTHPPPVPVAGGP